MPDRKFARAALVAAAMLGAAGNAAGFCGFYVGQADASLFNDASKVVMVRDGERTTINMLNDYKGELTEFALVVPVPEILQKEQVKTPFRALFDRIDAYSAPRLAEYYDRNPCEPQYPRAEARAGAVARMLSRDSAAAGELGVTVEAQYTVGPYDIVILSAEQSDGLETWLTRNGYRIPRGASRALEPYIRQEMKFFVAKVNLTEHAKSGAEFLAPLQFSFRTPKFMLPIRLGMINARGPQDLVLWVVTRNGRVETTNYRTVKLPTDAEIPAYLKSAPDQDFRQFYRALFDEHARREQYRVVFTEYFWDMAWCDPCAGSPLSAQELRNLGVEWVAAAAVPDRGRSGAQPVRVTRLHLRYTQETFPEDLVFQETGDRQNYQTRYVLRHPARVAPDACPAAADYLAGVVRRHEREAATLAHLTGWDVNDIRSRMSLEPSAGFWRNLQQRLRGRP